MKLKKCRNCQEPFKPFQSMQVVCSGVCGIAYARQQKAKKERKESRAKLEKLKPLAEHKKDLQKIFNEFIRLRDADQPCISCGRFHDGQYHAGHYRTVGANPELRFTELNCHKQCAPCNNHKSGNIVEYRKNLIEKIGAEKLAWLEGNHPPLKLTIDQIKNMKALYREKIKQIKTTRGQK